MPKKRGAKIHGEIVGYATNSDAFDFILPEPGRQAECMRLAVERAGLKPSDINILNAHATATQLGDIQECKALREVFGGEKAVWINNTKKLYRAHDGRSRDTRTFWQFACVRGQAGTSDHQLGRTGPRMLPGEHCDGRTQAT